MDIVCECENADSQDPLNVCSQRIGERHHNCQDSLPQHHDRFPENKTFFIGAIQKPSGICQPRILTRLMRTLPDQDISQEGRKSERENREDRPAGSRGENSVRSLVALQGGVKRPVLGGMIIVELCRIVDLDAVERVDGGLGDGDVGYEGDGQKAQQRPLREVPRVLFVLPSHEDPEDEVEDQYAYRNEEVDDRSQHRSGRIGVLIEEAVDRERHSCSGSSAYEVCRHSNQSAAGSRMYTTSIPAPNSKERIHDVQFTLMIAAAAITWRKLMLIYNTEQVEEEKARRTFIVP